jgi:hypothetical protein
MNIISLGAGVQSSTMALMAAHGEVTPMPDCAIFADTQAEPQSVYRWLDWLETQLPFPVHRVTRGDLSTESVRVRRSKKTGLDYLQQDIPAFTFPKSSGMMWRQCTERWKLRPIHTFLKPFKSQGVIQWLGISIDEAHRMRDARKPWIQNRYPLIEKSFDRAACLDWMAIKGFPQPPRSACVFCPYHSDAEWIRLKNDEPEEFQRAVDYEMSLQAAVESQNSLKRQLFLHPSCRPLSEVRFRHENQASLFGNECEGMCGV